MSARIVMLMHAGARQRAAQSMGYGALQLARYWVRDGLRVSLVFGTARFVPADVCFLHVDLSVVPEEYLAFTDRYPRTVNRRVVDIRKSRISRQLVRPGDGWDGPVIVKSDLNFAGGPERTLAGHRPGLFHSKADYRVFPRSGDVPQRYRDDPGTVIERFLPEHEDGRYHVRTFQFLGDRWDCYRTASLEPVVSFGNRVGASVPVQPDAAILASRERLGFDYGKFDYVMHGGKAVLLDVNKTPGSAPDHAATAAIRAARRRRSWGIRTFLD